jgi:hypothetical protein
MVYSNIHSVRPIRQAAKLAAVRITECVMSDNVSNEYNSESDTSPIIKEDGLTRARLYGYDDTAFVARFLLNQCNNAEYEDKRADIAEQLFHILNKNPNILIYEPKFRTVVQTKVIEFEEHLNNRVESFNKANYTDAIKMMKLSMRVNIRNSNMREAIYKHIAEISSILKEYDVWSKGDTFRLELNKMNHTLDTIKDHPDYVLS